LATKSGETISDQIQCHVLNVWIPGYGLNGAHGLADAFCLVECIAGIHGLSIDAVELHERNMIDELALRLVHGQLPVRS
jgi:hypothetical protein